MTQNRVLEVSRLQRQAPIAAGNNSYILRAFHRGLHYVLSKCDYLSSCTRACSFECTPLQYASCTRVQILRCGVCHDSELILVAGCVSTAHFCRNQLQFWGKLSRQFVLTSDGATIRLYYVELISRCQVTASRKEKE